MPHFNLYATYLTAAAAAIAASASAQTTWFVDAAATTPGFGTPQAPYNSIQYAIDQASTLAHHRLLLAPGIYVEEVRDDKGLIIEGAEGPTATVVRCSTAGGSCFVLGNQTHLGFTRLRGLWVEGAASSTVGVRVAHRHALQATHCIFTAHHVAIQNFYDAFFLQCNFTGNDTGVDQFGSGFGEMTSCILWDNTQDFGEGSLFGHPTTSFCLRANPITFGPNDPYLRRVSPCIDAGDPLRQLDPDGSLPDIGAVPYDFNYPLGRSFCFAQPNSTGVAARLQLIGSNSIVADDLTLHAFDCPPNTIGIFLVGREEGHVPIASGTLCIGGPFERLGLVTFDGTGVAEFGVPLPLLNGTLMAGDEWTFQCWFRDIGPSSNLTHGATASFAP